METSSNIYIVFMVIIDKATKQPKYKQLSSNIESYQLATQVLDSFKSSLSFKIDNPDSFVIMSFDTTKNVFKENKNGNTK